MKKLLKKGVAIIFSILICAGIIPQAVLTASATTYYYDIGDDVYSYTDYTTDGEYYNDTYVFTPENDAVLAFDIFCTGDYIFGVFDYEQSTLLNSTTDGELTVQVQANKTYAIMILSYGSQYYSFSSEEYVIAKRVSIGRNRVKMAVGDDYELKVKISPSNAKIGELKVSSSNRKVATVDEYGVITAKRLGTATISVKLTGKNTVKCKVTVDTQHIYLVENQKATIKFTPEVKKKWKSSNKKAATVTKSGKIKAVSDGKAIMTSKSGKAKFTCIVNVTNYDKLLKKAPQRLKDELTDPDSLKIYHIHYGYFKYTQGKIPVVLLDYGAKNGYGGMVRHHATFWYSGKKHKVSCNPDAVKEYLVGLKKQPLSRLKQENK